MSFNGIGDEFGDECDEGHDKEFYKKLFMFNFF